MVAEERQGAAQAPAANRPVDAARIMVESGLNGKVERPARNAAGPQRPVDESSIGMFERLAEALNGIRTELHRIANRLDPPPPDKVGTPYVADKLGCTTVWITEMVRSGEIPSTCVVPGTGYGKPWKFFRTRIEEWLRNR